MAKYKFKIGDRVKVKCERGFCSEKCLFGKIGTVKVLESAHNGTGVEFDEPFYSGHSCDGNCKNGYGRYGSKEELELIKSKKVKFEDYKKISGYV